jgi:hypothetical protein
MKLTLAALVLLTLTGSAAAEAEQAKRAREG